MKCKNILEAVGRTPIVRLNRITGDSKAQVYVKADYLNPGGSVKDRIGISMIDEAERKGLLKPGGTIIEGTSGNTGMGLALVAAVRGYKMVFTITDKQSKEKSRTSSAAWAPAGPSAAWASISRRKIPASRSSGWTPSARSITKK